MIRQQWSVNALSVELQLDRRQLAKRLEGLKPASETTNARGTDRLYHMADVVQHLYSNSEGHLDPARERAALDRVRREEIEQRLAVKAGTLIEGESYRSALSTVLKVVAATLEDLPDRMERQAHLPGPAVEVAVRVTDELRELLFKRIVETSGEL